MKRCVSNLYCLRMVWLCARIHNDYKSSYSTRIISGDVMNIKKKLFAVFAICLLVLLNYSVIQVINAGMAENGISGLIVKKIILLVGFDLVVLLYILKSKDLLSIPGELIKNRKLLFSLSKNDFKTKFAGSYLGIIWAFVQPIVTVFLYWFVFEKAFHARPQANMAAPYVLWLISGLVPWFYFSEAWSSGANSLIEYSYLVKKVVFKISILPMVKVISGLFVHFFFVAFTIVLFAFYGFYPDLYTLQIIYYLFCMIVLVMALAYFNSAIVIFFRDLSQIINILMQAIMWMSPIMWDFETLQIGSFAKSILKLNPLCYVIAGYRDSVINKVWFWEKADMTLYFWVVTALLFALGTIIFRKLQIHFADVL